MRSKPPKFANSRLQEIDFTLMNSPTQRTVEGCFSLVLLVGAVIIGVPIFLALSRGNLISFIFYCSLAAPAVIKLYRVTRRHFLKPSNIVMDPRPPILYLRSFFEDSEEDPRRFDRKTSEELMFQALNSIGPVLAVGNPRDNENATPLLGATRIYIEGNWQDEIKKLMLISQLIIIEANSTKGLLWEIEAARDTVHHQRLLFSFLSSSLYQSDNPENISLKLTEMGYLHKTFSKIFSNIFSTDCPINDSNTCFIYFDRNRTPRSVSIKHPKYVRFLNRSDGTYLSYAQIQKVLMLIMQANGLINNSVYAAEIERLRKKAAAKILEEQKQIRSKDSRADLASDGPSNSVKYAEEISASKTNPVDIPEFTLESFRKINILSLTAVIFTISLILQFFPLVLAVWVNENGVSKYLDSGLTCITKHNNKCAQENCSKAVELDPKSVVGYMCLGEAYFNENDYPQSIQHYLKVTELDPQNAKAYLNLEAAYFNLKEYDTGLSYLNRAIEIDRTNPLLFQRRGLIHYANGRNKAAIWDLDIAIRLKLMDWELHFQRGTVLLAEKNYDESIQDFTQAIRLAPDKFQLYYNRALAYVFRETNVSKLGDYQRAIDDLTHVIDLNPFYPDAYLNRSLLYKSLGNRKGAESDLREYRELTSQKGNQR